MRPAKESPFKVPLGLDKVRVSTFSKGCAKLRNDISHFGGLRPRSDPESGENYDELLRRLHDSSEALAVIYQMLLLHEIGVTEERLRWWIHQGFYSFRIKSYFVKVGLIDEKEFQAENDKARAEALKNIAVAKGTEKNIG
jgi:hypothetical protein